MFNDFTHPVFGGSVGHLHLDAADGALRALAHAHVVPVAQRVDLRAVRLPGAAPALGRRVVLLNAEMS